MEIALPSMMLAVLVSLPPQQVRTVYEPSYGRIRAGLTTPALSPGLTSQGPPLLEKVAPPRAKVERRGDSVWDGALIGLGVGGGSGYFWARGVCGGNDDECFAIAGPVGIITGGAIGAAVGAIIDALHR